MDPRSGPVRGAPDACRRALYEDCYPRLRRSSFGRGRRGGSRLCAARRRRGGRWFVCAAVARGVLSPRARDATTLALCPATGGGAGGRRPGRRREGFADGEEVTRGARSVEVGVQDAGDGASSRRTLPSPRAARRSLRKASAAPPSPKTAVAGRRPPRRPSYGGCSVPGPQASSTRRACTADCVSDAAGAASTWRRPSAPGQRSGRGGGRRAIRGRGVTPTTMHRERRGRGPAGADGLPPRAREACCTAYASTSLPSRTPRRTPTRTRRSRAAELRGGDVQTDRTLADETDAAPRVASATSLGGVRRVRRGDGGDLLLRGRQVSTRAPPRTDALRLRSAACHPSEWEEFVRGVGFESDAPQVVESSADIDDEAPAASSADVDDEVPRVVER